MSVLQPSTTPLGATPLGNGQVRFLVWAPKAKQITVEILAPRKQSAEMRALPGGYFLCEVDDLPVGADYFYRLDGGPSRPDPASRHQPGDVHGPSRVVDLGFAWSDEGWRGLSLPGYIIYELHIGTFTREGTFEAAIERLDELAALGVTAVEPLPIAQFPGSRNWGYDGVSLFAPQHSYGGPEGFFRFVDACHRKNLAVVLDVVYNHLGPEGNYLSEFGPYFSHRYRTPWGEALNFDSRGADEVRRFFIENAVSWIRDYHVDALRLDAIHAIFDNSARPFFAELSTAVREAGEALGRQAHTFAETNQNDPRKILAVDRGGCGFDAQWNDDFHHALRVAISGEMDGYYRDFASFADLGKALQRGFVYDGRHSSYRGRRHGAPLETFAPEQLVVFAQNHDQVGNRLAGDRLSTQLAAEFSFEQLKLAAAFVLLSPYTPMLFMGEEYGETAPFLYFISHLDPQLIENVRRGRRAEFAAFDWKEEVPDPQAEATFQRCKLIDPKQRSPQQATLWAFHQALIALRKELQAAGWPEGLPTVHVLDRERAIVSFSGDIACIYLFSDRPQRLKLSLPSGSWRAILDSSSSQWRGQDAAADSSLKLSEDVSGEAELERPRHSCLVLRQS